MSATTPSSDAENISADGAEFPASQGQRKRKRSLVTSCELCKSRKVKCDRNQPTCGWCARNGRSCVYMDRRKPGLRADYARELEEKIHRLEAIVQVLGRRVEDHILEHDKSDPGRPPQSDIEANYQSYDYSPYEGAGPRPTTADDSGSQNWPITSQSQPPDSNTGEQILDTPQPVDYSGSDIPTSTAAPLFSPISSNFDSGLPPYDLLCSLVDLYFKHVNPWSPILDRKATFDTILNSSTLSEGEQVLLYAIVTTTLRFSKDLRLSAEVRKQYHDISKQKVQLYGLDHPNVKALQALIIVALDVTGTSDGPQGWNLIALIARNVVQLGLATERSVTIAAPSYQSTSTLQEFLLPDPTSWTEDEERRRLLWMIYVLDRYATVATSFDFVLDDSEIDRPLPCRYDLFSGNQPVETRWFRHTDRSEMSVNRPENLGSFSYHCEVLRILSRIHRFLKRTVDVGSIAEVQKWRESYQELDAVLNAWLHNLPGEYGMISQLCHSDPASKISNWIMLHAAFVTCVIRLHSSAAYPAVQTQIFIPSYNAMQRCLGAVESLKEIAQSVISIRMLDLLGPQFAFSLWVSARLLLVHAATLECEVDPNLRFFISTLEEMGQYWDVAKTYAEILNRVADEYRRSEQTGRGIDEGRAATGSSSSNSTGRNSLGNMRRRAYELSLLISQRPRTVLEPHIVRTPSFNELEYLDVFDFFNYPRLPPNTNNTAAATTKNLLDSNVPNHSHYSHNPKIMPPPHNAATEGVNFLPDSTSISSGNSTSLLLPSVHDLRSPNNLAMPNPDMDWLAFKPPHD